MPTIAQLQSQIDELRLTIGVFDPEKEAALQCQHAETMQLLRETVETLKAINKAPAPLA